MQLATYCATLASDSAAQPGVRRRGRSLTYQLACRLGGLTAADSRHGLFSAVQSGKHLTGSTPESLSGFTHLSPMLG